jgi:hypothetical protein
VGSPDDRQPLAGATTDGEVSSHLLQHRCPNIPELPRTPATERADDPVDGDVVDEVHSPRSKFIGKVN